MTACTGQPGYLPKFQPQNPARSGDPYGWDDCTAFSGAMAADFDTCGAIHPLGGQVRRLSDEPVPDPNSPGLNLRQIDDALNRIGVDLETQYRLPWADFVRKITKGEGAVLQGATGPFLSTQFRSTEGDINHAIFVPPGWGAMDPAADGRVRGWGTAHQYDGRAYPQGLLESFAGHLVLDIVNGHPNRLGFGYVFAAFTRDRRSTWTWQHGPGKFVLWSADEVARTCKAVKTQRTGGTQRRSCTPPRLYRAPDGSHRSLVRMLTGSYKNSYVNSQFATEVP